MAEDVKPEVIKKTQDILGNFIKKPILTEKLLKKPPFRFLHDICTAAMRETGFFEDVLNSPRDKFENIKDKEGKIEFLQKVIAAVESANGIKLTVKPNKIVAGLEPNKTNEFLQALGKALENKVENKNSKTSESTKVKSTKKPSKEVKEEPPDKKKNNSSRSSKKIIENGVQERNKSDTQTAISPKKKQSKNLKDSEPKHENEKHEKTNEGNSNKKSVSNTMTNGKTEIGEEKISLEKANISGAGESKDMPDVDYIKVNGFDGQGDQNLQTKEEIIPESETRRGNSGKHKNRRPSNQNFPELIKVGETIENNENTKTELTGEKKNVVNQSENILREQNRATPSPSAQNNITSTNRGTTATKEGKVVLRPRTGIRPTTARPASARPAAPRIRDRGEVAVAEEVVKPASGKVHVIEDKDSNNDAEDENLISLEATNDILIEEPPSPLPQATSSTTEQEHGRLVEQILEVQRELEGDEQSPEKATGKTEIEWNSSKSKECNSREIEKLRSNIQKLTRTANPLGKLLDFFQEDIDTVQKELEFWKEKNSNLSLQIAQERSVTDQFVEPLKIHLKELQQSIDEQLDLITLVKGNIIRNNEKINKILTGM